MAKAIHWKSEEETMMILGFRNKYALRNAIYQPKRIEQGVNLPIRYAKLSKSKVLYSGNDIEEYILSKAS